VPSRLTPFVGGGVGVVGYEFDQAGDWVDFATLEVFPDRLRTTGTGVSGYLGAGADIALGKQFVITAEARYTLANGPVGGAYSGFDRIDLSGVQLLAGLALRW
jgi:opacity protein-like surface antigen